MSEEALSRSTGGGKVFCYGEKTTDTHTEVASDSGGVISKKWPDLPRLNIPRGLSLRGFVLRAAGVLG